VEQHPVIPAVADRKSMALEADAIYVSLVTSQQMKVVVKYAHNILILMLAERVNVTSVDLDLK